MGEFLRDEGSLDRDYYDVAAKTSVAHTEDELQVMFQAVLAERFGVGIHREKRELQAYVLTVDEKGLKMTEATGGGESVVAPNPKRMAVEMKRTSIVCCVGGVGDGLSRVLQMPVVDETRLKGSCDAVQDMTRMPEEMRPAAVSRWIWRG